MLVYRRPTGRFPATLLVLFLLFATHSVHAQLYDAGDPAPQYLYRSDDGLIMVNGYTGETSVLDIDATEQDFFSWTPDGAYLLAAHRPSNVGGSCINFYDVDTETWLYDEPISCEVQEVEYAANGTAFAYTTLDESGGSLWLHNLEDGSNQEIYRAEGAIPHKAGISAIEWSPTGNYLTFIHYVWLAGGTLNNFVVLDIESGEHFWVTGADPYYAHYEPIWSEDDAWFLIKLQAQYMSGGIPRTNHKGDLYLVNNKTGDQYRLTYTPAVAEYDVHWADDGSIAFTVAIEHQFNFSLDDAMNVEVVPYEDIVQPDDLDIEAYANFQNEDLISPDRDFSAWVTSTMSEAGEYIYELNIGLDYRRYGGDTEIIYSATVPENYEHGNVLIGWRPSDYSYSQG